MNDRESARRRNPYDDSDPETFAVQKASFVDQQIRAAMARGAFDDLPLHGKPIPDLGDTHDPDWWVKRLIDREDISGVLPEALQLRKDDGALDDVLDRLGSERAVRDAVEANVLDPRRGGAVPPGDLVHADGRREPRRPRRHAARVFRTRGDHS